MWKLTLEYSFDDNGDLLLDLRKVSDIETYLVNLVWTTQKLKTKNFTLLLTSFIECSRENRGFKVERLEDV